MFWKFVDEFMQRSVRFRVALFRTLLRGEKKVGARGRPAPGITLDHPLIVLRGLRAGQKRSGVGCATGMVKFVTRITEPAEQEHDDHGDDGRLVLIPEKLRLERGISGDLRYGGHGNHR